MKLFCLLGVVLAWVGVVNARPWKDATGRVIEVAMWRVEGEQVIFVLNGKDSPVPLAKLCAEDQAFVKQWLVDHPAPVVPGKAAAARKVTRADIAPKKLPNGDVINGDVIIDQLPDIAFEPEVARYLSLSTTLLIRASAGRRWRCRL